VHAEHGQAGEVDRGGQQPPVLPDPQQPAHAGPAPAMSAAEQVRQLAFDLGAVRAVVGPPGGIPLPLAGSSEQHLVGWMLIVRPARLLVHPLASGQTAQARPKRASPPRHGAG
jgi:hypothetical protein